MGVHRDSKRGGRRAWRRRVYSRWRGAGREPPFGIADCKRRQSAPAGVFDTREHIIMTSCPACGWQMRKGDLRLARFACPGCKTRLRLEEARHTGLDLLGGGLLALIVTYLAGAQGYAYLFYAGVLYLIFSGVAGALRGFLFPRKLQRDMSADDVGGILHITGPPDPPSGPAGADS